MKVIFQNYPLMLFNLSKDHLKPLQQIFNNKKILDIFGLVYIYLVGLEPSKWTIIFLKDLRRLNLIQI